MLFTSNLGKTHLWRVSYSQTSSNSIVKLRPLAHVWWCVNMSEIHRRIPKKDEKMGYSFISILKFGSEICSLSSVCSTYQFYSRAVYLHSSMWSKVGLCTGKHVNLRGWIAVIYLAHSQPVKQQWSTVKPSLDYLGGARPVRHSFGIGKVSVETGWNVLIVNNPLSTKK